jgi:hypothetical protein
LVIARGADEILVEVAQQLSWIGASLRVSPPGEHIAYSEAAISAMKSHDSPNFEIPSTL